MSSDGPPTQRKCPACGGNGPRDACHVCKGRGLVTPDELRAWLRRQAVRRTTSSLHDVPSQTKAALVALQAKRSAQVMPLITVGEALLQWIEREPLSEEAMIRLSEWLTAVQSYLRGER